MENTSTRRKLITASLLSEKSKYLPKNSEFDVSPCGSGKSCASENKTASSETYIVDAKPNAFNYDATDTNKHNYDSDVTSNDATIYALKSDDAADENKSDCDLKNDSKFISIATESRTNSAADKSKNEISLILDEPKADFCLKTKLTTTDKLQPVAANSKYFEGDVIVNELETDVESNTCAALKPSKTNDEEDAVTIIQSRPYQSILHTSKDFER